jgi:hypothetical protein
LSAPTLAKTTLADFRGGGESLDRLLAHVHKSKKGDVGVEKGGGGFGHIGSSTPAITPIGAGGPATNPQ